MPVQIVQKASSEQKGKKKKDARTGFVSRHVEQRANADGHVGSVGERVSRRVGAAAHELVELGVLFLLDLSRVSLPQCLCHVAVKTIESRILTFG